MNLVDRVKKMVLTPQSEWEVVAQEPASVVGLYKDYIAPLSAIGPVAAFIGMSIFGTSVPFMGSIRVPLLSGVSRMVVSYVLGLAGVYLLALLIDALAPTFGGEKDRMQALKVAAFSATPVWIAGVLHILPALGILVLLAALYSLFVLYLGLQILMKSPKDKALAYTIVVIVIAIVVGAVFGLAANKIAGFGMYSSGAGSGLQLGDSSKGGDALARLKQMGDSMKAANKNMEAAKQSGNPQAQVQAAGAAIGAALGGGIQYDPLDKQVLKGLLPDTVDGLKRTTIEAEKVSMGAFKISKANAGYGDTRGHNITLTLTDAGGVSFLGGLAAWSMIEQDKETDNGYEKMGKVDGRPVHEKFDTRGMDGEYSVVVGGRFLVEAHGRRVDMKELKQAVALIDINKLEGMKTVGIKK